MITCIQAFAAPYLKDSGRQVKRVLPGHLGCSCIQLIWQGDKLVLDSRSCRWLQIQYKHVIYDVRMNNNVACSIASSHWNQAALKQTCPGAIGVLPAPFGLTLGAGRRCSTPGLTLRLRGYSLLVLPSRWGDAARSGT